MRRAIIGRIGFLAVLMFGPVMPARAQCSYTQVSATVADPSGIPYGFANVSADLVPSPPGGALCTGNVAFPGHQGPIQANASGFFTMLVPSNGSITPSGTKWQFTIGLSPGVAPPFGTGPQSFKSAIIISGATQNITSTLNALAPALAYITTGTAGNPAGPGAAIQFANAGVTAFATSTVGGSVFGVDSLASPTFFNIPFSEAIAGPRPWIDPTSTVYGADPTGATDSTAALQAAFNAACTSGTAGFVMLPQGTYAVTMPQTGSASTSPALSIPSGCQGYGKGFYLKGAGSGFAASQQFSFLPQSKIVATPGANPSMGPILFAGQNQDTTRFEGLYLAGYNQDIQINNTAGVYMLNIATSTQNTGQGIQTTDGFVADNVGLAIYNSFWFWCDYCDLQGTSGVTTLPVLLLAGVTGPNRGINGLGYFNGGIWSGGGVLYDQRGTVTAAPGDFHFRDITVENSGTQPFWTVNSESSPVTNDMERVTFDHVIMSDNSATAAFAVLNATNWIHTDYVFAGAQSNAGPAVQLNSGTMLGCVILGAASVNRAMLNSSGNLVGGCTGSNNYGTDFVSSPSDASLASITYNTNMVLPQASFGFFGSQYGTTPIRMAPSSSAFATLGISPISGMSQGPSGTASGYDANIGRTATQTESIRLARTSAPASPAIALAAGGTLTVATTYFYIVRTTLVATTCLDANESGPTIELSVTPTSGNQTASLTWTPVGDPFAVGYCVWRGTALSRENTFFYVSGASTASFSDTGTAGTAQSITSRANATFPTNPQYTWGLQGGGTTNANQVGHTTLSSGTATVSFSPHWNSAPVCVVNDQTTAGGAKIVPTASAATITGGTSDVVDYFCYGNPN